MADLNLNVSEPVSAIISAASQIAIALLNYATTVRATQSQAARDAADHAANQAYWDWRALLQALHVVGDPIPIQPPAVK